MATSGNRNTTSGWSWESRQAGGGRHGVGDAIGGRAQAEGTAHPVYDRQRKEQSFEEACKNYTTCLILYVRTEMYKRMLILNDNEDDKYGSIWQKLLCHKAGVPKEDQQEYWNEKGGMVAAREALRRKRSNLTNAMKERFEGGGTRMCCKKTG
jgi:hypothetical protein